MMLLPSCLLGMTEVTLPFSASTSRSARLAQASSAACDSSARSSLAIRYVSIPGRAYEGVHLSPRMA